jgi:hypothetical protein
MANLHSYSTMSENIITSSSDHFAVQLSICKDARRRPSGSRGQNFKYEAAWCRAPDYLETVEKSWKTVLHGPKSLQATWTKLTKMSETLSAFWVTQQGDLKLEKRLLRLRNDNATRTYSQEEKDIERRLCELFEREEIMI